MRSSLLARAQSLHWEVVEAAYEADGLASLMPQARSLSDVADLPVPLALASEVPTIRQAGGLDIATLGDLIALVDSRPAPRYLVRGIIAAGDYGVLAAEPKAGKTWAMTDLAVSVASGASFLGSFDVDSEGPVLVFAGEGGDRKIARRMAAVCASKGIDVAKVADRIFVCLRAPHLADRDGAMAAVEAEIARIRPALVIIDPLYLAARGANTSDLAEMGAHLEAAQSACQRHGAALMIAHHWNKTGQGSGASRISGAGPAAWGRVLLSMAVRQRKVDPTTGRSDVALELEATGDEIPESTIRLRRVVWADDLADLGSSLHYVIERLPDVAGDRETDPDGLSSTERRVLAAFESEPARRWTVTAVGDFLADDKGGAFPLKKRTIQAALSALTNSGRIEADNRPGRPGAWHLAGAQADLSDIL